MSKLMLRLYVTYTIKKMYLIEDLKGLMKK